MTERAAGLNELGVHYFAGWLISAGFQKPEVMAEIETLLEEMKNDPALQYRPLAQDPAVAHTLTAKNIPSPELLTPSVTSADAPPPSAVSAPSRPVEDIVQFEKQPARRLSFPARLLASLFPRRRLAA